jgi:GntR family transcriptional regulator
MVNRTRKSATDAESRVPRYLQLASALRRRINDGIWPIGERIATLQELEREFGVARVTVRQAVEVLHREGLLKSHQGKGTFVTGASRSERWLQLATNWESLIAPINENIPRLLPVSHVPDPCIDPDDGRPAPAYVFLKSVQRRGQEPYALARVHVASHVHERAPREFATRVALAVISGMKGVRIARAHQTLSISAADIETARSLQIPLNAPIAEARCVVVDDDGVVIYVGEITYRGDCVRLNIELIGSEGRNSD